MDDFHYVCLVEDIKESEGKRFFINDVDIAMFKVNGEIFALNNVCPHQHAAVIYDGFIENGRVTCPVHGWEFDLKTGKLGGERKGLDCYEVKLDGNRVFVKARQKEWNW